MSEREDLVPLVRELERTGGETRSVLEDAARSGEAPGAERVAPTLERLAAERSAARARRVRRLAAAVLLAMLAIPLVRSLRTGPSPAPVYLSGGGLELLLPVGEVESFERFLWRFDAPARTRYQVLVFDGDLADGAALAESPRLAESEWRPSAEERRGWPETIRWEVRALDASRQPVGSGWARASLRSR